MSGQVPWGAAQAGWEQEPDSPDKLPSAIAQTQRPGRAE